MIRFACYQCGHVFRARDDQAGKAGKCKRCGVPLQIPVFIPAGPAPGPDPGPMPPPAPGPAPAPNPLGFLNTPPDASTVNLGGRRRRARFGSTLGLPFAAPAVRIEPPKDAGGGMSFEPPEWLASLLQIVVTLGILSKPITVPVALSRDGCLSLGRWLCLALFCGLACFGMVFLLESVWQEEHAQRGARVFFRPEINALLGVLLLGTPAAFASGMVCVLAAALHPKPKAV